MQQLLESFITLFVIMDPIGNLPFFASLTKGMPIREIKKNASRSVLVAGTILFLFLFLSIKIFRFFSININSFQIGGGIILLVIAVMYVLGMPNKFGKPHGGDLSVPIGTPLLAGPGAITITIILVKENGMIVTFIAVLLALLATWVILMNSTRLYRLLGEHWTNIISRVMGLVLAAIAVKFITEGILNIVAQVV